MFTKESRTTFLVSPLVKGSAKFFSDRTNSKEMVPSFTCESHCMDTGTDVPYNGTSPSRFLIHSASYPANSNAINSDSIVDLAIQVCFADFQDIAPPPSKNTYPLVELTSSLSMT
ncbi:putative RING-H2 finger protein ATL71 [Cucumis melo var. makuwa]|uniref:RING-H2 finger protein ATL71 n=1 Tax=Cucumis melo var. makuwa TaxID=1194695 RepID=A0A5D3C5U3_CUCMM|nr:putative RING-H2 finger protein ATL71 [Cucumis melo var. makuwa]TYK07227.1 putative RING-H2 finger protein ATL71 [Cucumis melo var. makuwa]